MKLNDGQIRFVESQTSLSAIDDNHPGQQELEDKLGAHTFLLGQEGLFIFEQEGSAEHAHLFAVATWSEEEKDALVPQDPPIGLKVRLDLKSGAIEEVQ